MQGGPRNLYYLLSAIPEPFKIFCSLQNFSWTKLDPDTWVKNAEYVFFDYPYEIDKKATTVSLNGLTKRSRLLCKIDNRIDRYFLQHRNLKMKVVGLILQHFNNSLRILLLGFRQRKSFSSIVAISDIGWSLIGSFLLSVFTRKPLITFFFDLYKDNHLEWPNKFLARFFEPLIIWRSRKIIVTNEATAEHFSKKYHCRNKITVIHNVTGTDQIPSLPASRKAPKRKIVFAGHIYWPQQQSLMNLIQIAKPLGEHNISLTLYALSPPKEVSDACANNANITLTQTTSQELIHHLREADLLFLPFAWDSLCPEIVNSASPAKLSEYLSVCRPILVHAPSTTYVSQLIRNNQCGIVVDINDPQALLNNILDYFNGNIEKNELLFQENCRALHNRLFATKLNQEIFLNCLSSV